MGFWNSLFGGSYETPEEARQHQEEQNFDVLKTDGQKASRLGQNDYAIRCFKMALEIKDDLEVRDYLAHALIRNNQLAEAIEELNILQDAEPDNVEIALLKSHVYYMDENYTAMKETLEKYIPQPVAPQKEGEQNSQVNGASVKEDSEGSLYYWLAKAEIGLNEDDKAIEMLGKAIETRSDFWDAYLLRAQTYLKVNKIDEAEKDSRYLLEEIGEQEETLLMRARIKTKKGETEQAISDYDKVIESNPFSVEGFRERAMLKKLLGDEDGFKEDMETSASINSNGMDENIEEQIKQQYKSIDPYGIFG